LRLAASAEFATDGDAQRRLSRPRTKPARANPFRALRPQGADKREARPDQTHLHPVDGALIYILQMCLQPQPEDGWTDLPISTKSSCEVDGAEPGKIAWFRGAAVNTAGQSPWSTAAQRPVM